MKTERFNPESKYLYRTQFCDNHWVSYPRDRSTWKEYSGKRLCDFTECEAAADWIETPTDETKELWNETPQQVPDTKPLPIRQAVTAQDMMEARRISRSWNLKGMIGIIIQTRGAPWRHIQMQGLTLYTQPKQREDQAPPKPLNKARAAWWHDHFTAIIG